jgi:hypothetical protein
LPLCITLSPNKDVDLNAVLIHGTPQILLLNDGPPLPFHNRGVDESTPDLSARLDGRD